MTTALRMSSAANLVTNKPYTQIFVIYFRQKSIQYSMKHNNNTERRRKECRTWRGVEGEQGGTTD
jgi:hypothetical protein